jgi:chloramphenicol 3-O phosphotransferase
LKKVGKIIIINGASSSGKTSIVKAVQNLMEEPYLDAGLDRFLWMLPKRYLDRPLWDDVLGLADRAGDAGHLLAHGMHHAIASLAQCGMNVVADHVLVDQAWLWECASLFAGLPAWFIGVRCPLDVLEEREKSRRDRTLGQARLQHKLVHIHEIYDLEVDTSVLSSDECAALIQQRLVNGPPGDAFTRIANWFRE